mmetsp:Transcript_66941/g.211953  ORF Transcript_66941/g.211953 Transcript_66941/m.211953 type:complete len:251 (+) Transcript_66941:122-874(+)
MWPICPKARSSPTPEGRRPKARVHMALAAPSRRRTLVRVRHCRTNRLWRMLSSRSFLCPRSEVPHDLPCEEVRPGQRWPAASPARPRNTRANPGRGVRRARSGWSACLLVSRAAAVHPEVEAAEATNEAAVGLVKEASTAVSCAPKGKPGTEMSGRLHSPPVDAREGRGSAPYRQASPRGPGSRPRGTWAQGPSGSRCRGARVLRRPCCRRRSGRRAPQRPADRVGGAAPPDTRATAVRDVHQPWDGGAR